MFRLQGFPDDFSIAYPYLHIKRQCGNAVAMPVIKAVAKAMLQALKAKPIEEHVAIFTRAHPDMLWKCS